MTNFDQESDLRGRLSTIDGELKEIEQAEELTDELEARSVELIEESTVLFGRIEKAVERAEKVALIRSAAEEPTNVVAGASANPVPVVDRSDKPPWDYDELTSVNGPGAVSELRSRALDAAERVPRASDAAKSRLTALIERLGEDETSSDYTVATGTRKTLRHILAVSHPDYASAFNSTLQAFGRHGVTNGPGSEYLVRAMSLTDAAGGFAVPVPIDPTLIVNDDGTESPFRDIATVKTISTDTLSTVNTTAVSASWDGEAGEVSDDATTFANIIISVYKAQAFVPFSIEAGQDFPDLQGTIGSLIATEKGDLEAAAHATGTGSSQPVGIVTALTGGSYQIASNATDTFALGDVYDLEEELPTKHGRRASWVANKRIYQAIREAGGANLDDFWTALGGGRSPELLGYPALESSEMDGTITGSAHNYVLVLGDFKNYWIVDRAGLSIELVPHLFATGANRPSGQRGIYAWWRTGADSVNDRAFRMLNVT